MSIRGPWSRCSSSGGPAPSTSSFFKPAWARARCFQATDAPGLTEELMRHLSQSTVVVRGPKPVGELNARASANRHTGCLAVHHGNRSGGLAHCRCGGRGAGAALRRRESGAVRRAGRAAVPAYRRLPLTGGHCRPTPAARCDLLEALARSSVDAAVFTSAVQIHNLHAVAAQSGAPRSSPAS